MGRALGRYELLRPLARGGMAEVYLARRRAAGVEKWLVVKRMRPETSGDPRFLELFVREARLSMSLVHQNIVPVFDFGKIDDQVFLAMERVEGKDLGSSLARAASHRLPPLLAAFIAAECCQALDYAHQRKGPDGVALGIVHRDVTPRNVLLSWSGEVKLTDFGIAALAGDATSRLLGTPQYMAPEQARSEPIDPRADIYAIGLILREAVTGVRPRPGQDREAILEAARRGALLPWPAIAAPAPGADEPAGAPEEPPAALVAIIDRATSALPADRYPDVRAMLEELDSFIVGQRAAHRAESPARQLAAWLAAVWDGARDDVEPTAAIEAGQLLSFSDDGALDLLGTGTVRSMAATAAEDLPPPAPAPAPPAASPPDPASPAIGSPARTTGPVQRLSRISSSVATVASGSIHTLAAGGSDANRTRPGPLLEPPPRRRPGRLVPIAGILIAASAAAGGVFALARRDRPEPRVAATGVRDERPAAGQPAPAPSAPASAAPAAPGPGSNAAPPDVAPPAVQPTGGPAPAPRRSQAGSASTPGRPASGRPGARPSHAPGPPAAPHDAPGSASPAREPTEAPEPRTCRVRINLTPWAYYTADGDTTRHETPGTIDLTPGTHRLHVWNPELKIERDITLHVPADRETMNYSEPLQP